MATPTRGISKPPPPAIPGGGLNAPAGTPGNPVLHKQPHRVSQFVLTSPITNAPQTAFLATTPNTTRQLAVAKQRQVQDPKVIAKANKNAPGQVIAGATDGPAKFGGYALSFANQPGVTSVVATPVPNKSYAALHGLRVPNGTKTQAAAAHGFKLTS